jgi:hypothetical protein
VRRQFAKLSTQVVDLLLNLRHPLQLQAEFTIDAIDLSVDIAEQSRGPRSPVAPFGPWGPAGPGGPGTP